MSLFEKATRENFLFPSRNGDLNVIQLWTLPITSTTNKASLSEIAKTLDSQVNEGSSRLDYLNTTSVTKQQQLILDKLEVVKAIVVRKQQEAQERVNEHKNAQLREILLEEKQRRENEGIKNLSDEELEQRLKALV